MGDNLPANPATTSTSLEERERFLNQIRRRYFRALDYLSIYAFIIIVYGGALITDYSLFLLVAWLLREDVQKYPAVALWFDYARTGLALLLITLAVVHGIISTFNQIKLDLALSREGEGGK